MHTYENSFAGKRNIGFNGHTVSWTEIDTESQGPMKAESLYGDPYGPPRRQAFSFESHTHGSVYRSGKGPKTETETTREHYI